MIPKLDEVNQGQCLQLAASVAVQVKDSLLGLLVRAVEDVPLQFLSVAVVDCEVDSLDVMAVD